MGNHPIESLVYTALKNLEEMIDVNKIIGTPLKTAQGETIIPVSKVSFGCVAGGTQFGKEEGDNSAYPFGGGSGGGVSVSPVAFLVVGKNGISIKHLSDEAHVLEKAMDMIPVIIERAKESYVKKNNN